MVVTDPPYGIGEAAGKNLSRGKVAPATDYGNDSWDDRPVSQELIDNVIQAGVYACIFGGNYYTMPPSPSWFVWDKQNAGNDFADAELAWSNYGGAVRIIKHRWNGMLRKGNEPRWHPTQKPLHVITQLITRCPLYKQGKLKTVIDPFMGSGTTMRACLELGLFGVGIEREEKYCEVAAIRLSQGVLPLEC